MRENTMNICLSFIVFADVRDNFLIKKNYPHHLEKWLDVSSHVCFFF